MRLPMPRPHCPRWIAGAPACTVFKPAGTPLRELEEILLTLDELEALRLSDAEGLYQEDAAARMGVSRPTLGRVLASARKKVADALVLGRALRIEGGPVALLPPQRRCPRCARAQRSGATAGSCPRCALEPAPPNPKEKP
jgi:predicted DNA-binding protein (UPF0251 family)